MTSQAAVEVVTDLNQEADGHSATGNFGSAIETAETALEIAREQLGPSKLTAVTELHLADLCRRDGRYGQAERHFLEVLRMSTEALGEDDPMVAGVSSSLALLYRDAGRHCEARELLVNATDVQRAAVEGNHPRANRAELATALNNLGRLERQLGEFAAARADLEDSLALREKLSGKASLEFAHTLRNLAELDQTLGRFGKAEQKARRVLATYRALLDARNPLIAEALAILRAVAPEGTPDGAPRSTPEKGLQPDSDRTATAA
jgi:tetratricopeptide (TPR) repeat protein